MKIQDVAIIFLYILVFFAIIFSIDTPVVIPVTEYVYGEMHFHSDEANGHAITINTLGVYENITGFNGTPSAVIMTQIFTTEGISFINSTNSLRCDVTARFKSWYKVSYGNVGNNQEYQFQLAKNGIGLAITDDHRKIGAAGDVGSISGGGSFNCNAGDIINLQAKDNDGTANIYIHVATVILEKLIE